MTFPSTSPPLNSEKRIRPVISCLLKNKDEILILKRSCQVGSFQGYWSCISGYMEKEEDPLETAYREVFEETKIPKEEISNHFLDGPFYSEAEDVVFEAHWVLMETKIKRIVLDWEHESCQWINSKKIPDVKVVPWLPTLIKYLLAKA
jgi:8-oxo-dGTP pyrophosphatase MutT (NUDIX family)